LLWTGKFLPGGNWGIVLAALPLLASTYQFCRVRREDRGPLLPRLPEHWNVIAYYAFVMQLSQHTLAILLVLCSLLVFVPVKYIYPFRTRGGTPHQPAPRRGWLVSYARPTDAVPGSEPVVLPCRWGNVAYYILASVYLTLRTRRRATTPTSLRPGSRAADVALAPDLRPPGRGVYGVAAVMQASVPAGWPGRRDSTRASCCGVLPPAAGPWLRWGCSWWGSACILVAVADCSRLFLAQTGIAMSFVVSAVMAIVRFGERLSWLEWSAVVAVVTGWCCSRPRPGPDRGTTADAGCPPPCSVRWR